MAHDVLPIIYIQKEWFINACKVLLSKMNDVKVFRFHGGLEDKRIGLCGVDLKLKVIGQSAAARNSFYRIENSGRQSMKESIRGQLGHANMQGQEGRRLLFIMCKNLKFRIVHLDCAGRINFNS